mmetsp:Transcript_56802/g.100788  ORF Transcript_56802/g.100788 Transcript_56802/m.100788 type:complete len:125 (+) Transcript_56802:1451-1825(+)
MLPSAKIDNESTTQPSRPIRVFLAISDVIPRSLSFRSPDLLFGRLGVDGNPEYQSVRVPTGPSGDEAGLPGSKGLGNNPMGVQSELPHGEGGGEDAACVFDGEEGRLADMSSNAFCVRSSEECR